jgi:hypothetical protein
MRKTIRSGISLAVAAALLIGLSCWVHIARAAVHTADSPPGDIAAGAWQHHKVSFNYVGFTALYACQGLEDQVRQILLYLGARKDVHVSARGCPGPLDTPSHNASVNADFYTLAPVAGAGASDTVKARWTAFELTPRHPGFMGDGDCELMEGMKDLITKNFSLRDLEYRTDCYPNAVTPDSFAVKAQALRALPQTSTASRIAPVASPY